MSEVKQEMTPEEKLNIVLKMLRTIQMDARYYIADKVRSTQTYQNIMGLEKRDLPKHINEHEHGSAQHFIISCRLSGDDPFEKDLSKCISILYDEEFSVEDYKAIGYNDGQATAAHQIFDAIGMIDDAHKCLDATYTFD